MTCFPPKPQDLHSTTVNTHFFLSPTIHAPAKPCSPPSYIATHSCLTFTILSHPRVPCALLPFSLAALYAWNCFPEYLCDSPNFFPSNPLSKLTFSRKILHRFQSQYPKSISFDTCHCNNCASFSSSSLTPLDSPSSVFIFRLWVFGATSGTIFSFFVRSHSQNKISELQHDRF